MSSRTRLEPTRSNLLRAREQLARVRKSTDVVRKKRQALVAHLFRIARPALDARARIERGVDYAYAALAEALAVSGRDGLHALGWPERRVEVEVRPAQIWGVAVADVDTPAPLRRTLDARATPPGSIGPSAIEAADRFEALTELLIAAAPNELRVNRLAAAVAEAARQLRVLEQRVEPELHARIALVRRTLEEREREEHQLLKHLQRHRGARRT